MGAWEHHSGRTFGADYDSIRAAAIDESGCLCTIGLHLDLTRQNLNGALVQVGSLRDALSEEQWDELLDFRELISFHLAVSTLDWFVADLHGHRILRFREGVGV